MEQNFRSEILEESLAYINGGRNTDYGDPLDNFSACGSLWQSYLERTIQSRGGLDIRPHDVAVMMMLVKIARIAWTPDKKDHWADIAGYDSCGWDCVQRQDADPLESQRPDEQWI